MGANNQQARTTFAHAILPVLRELEMQGITRKRVIAKELNARGIRTIRGCLWTEAAVARLFSQLEISG